MQGGEIFNSFNHFVITKKQSMKLFFSYLFLTGLIFLLQQDSYAQAAVNKLKKKITGLQCCARCFKKRTYQPPYNAGYRFLFVWHGRPQKNDV